MKRISSQHSRAYVRQTTTMPPEFWEYIDARAQRVGTNRSYEIRRAVKLLIKYDRRQLERERAS